VCFIDADLQNPPEDVWRLYQELLFTRADLVQGIRSTLVRERDSRYYLSRGLNVLLNALFGMRAPDNKSGFVLGRKEILEDVLRHRFRYKYYQTFIRVAAHFRGYTVRDVETLFEKRLAGESFMARFPLRVVSGVFIDLAKALFEFRIVRKRENTIADFVHEVGVREPPEAPEAWRTALFEAFCATMPVHKWQIRRSARWYYDELRHSQWLTPPQVRELQERKMRALVSHAYYHVPFYRDLFDAAGSARRTSRRSTTCDASRSSRRRWCGRTSTTGSSRTITTSAASSASRRVGPPVSRSSATPTATSWRSAGPRRCAGSR
jgi:phenylacetate-CoA ligase